MLTYLFGIPTSQRGFSKQQDGWRDLGSRPASRGLRRAHGDVSTLCLGGRVPVPWWNLPDIQDGVLLDAELWTEVFSTRKNPSLNTCMIHLNWWPWGNHWGGCCFFPNMCLKVCASEFHGVVEFSKVFLLSGWRFEENWSCFLVFFLWFSSVWKAQVYSESKKFKPSKTTNFHQTICKLQTNCVLYET